MTGNPRVLIVEDEPSIAELIAVNLRHHGLDPVVAFEGMAAQREIDTAAPDLVLLDWMLPGQSGESLARKWRKSEKTAHIPIIMLTARTEESDMIAGWMPVQTTMSPNPFQPKNYWHASVQCCVADQEVC